MIRSALLAAALGIATMAGSATAAPISNLATPAATDGVAIEKVQARRDRSERRRAFRQGRRFERQRLRRPPRGWRRYNARPRYWQRRGCITIGPVWFCP